MIASGSSKKEIEVIIHKFTFLKCKLVEPRLTEVKPGTEIRDPKFEVVVTGLAIPFCFKGYKFPPCYMTIYGGKWSLVLKVGTKEVKIGEVTEPSELKVGEFHSKDCVIYEGWIKLWNLVAKVPNLGLEPGEYKASLILKPVEKILLTCWP